MKMPGTPALALVLLAPELLGATAPVTVYLRFEATPDAVTFAAMRGELDRLFHPTYLRFDWRRIEEASELGPVSDLAVVTFRGLCQPPVLPPLMDERGPYAWTSITDGIVLPFATIDCTRVRNAVYAALWGGERSQSASLLGRALARVVAHELFHVYTRSAGHAREGIAKSGISAAALIAEKGVLHPEDLHPDKELLSTPSKTLLATPPRDSLP